MTKEEQALHQHDRDSWLGKAITISADLTRCVIKAVREAGFAYFVSPGEADQQLVHLCRSGLADYIWTMDGDIVAQGVPVIRDLDFTTKFGVVYQLKASKWWKSVRSSYVFAFFAGCDYNRGGVRNIGPAKAIHILSLVDDHANSWTITCKAFQEYPELCWREYHFGGAELCANASDTDRECAALEMMHHMNCVITSFEDGIVYDPGSKAFRTLSGSDTRHDRPQARAQLMSLGLCCGDLTCLCHEDSMSYHGIGPVTTMIVDGDLSPVHLGYDMVEGSWISDDELYERNGKKRPTIDRLKRWLLTRAFPLSTTLADGTTPMDKAAGLLRHVQDMRQLEIDRCDRGEDVVLLTSPEGICLHDYLLERGDNLGAILSTEALKLDLPGDASHWSTNMLAIRTEAPIVDFELMREYYRDKDTSPSNMPAVLIRSFNRIASRTRFDGLRGCSNVPGHPGWCVFQVHIPASMRKQKFEVTVVLDMLPLSPGSMLRHAGGILHTCCSCIAGKYKCVHSCSALQILVNLSRPPEAEVESYWTSTSCWWNVPPPVHCSFDINQEIAKVAFFPSLPPPSLSLSLPTHATLHPSPLPLNSLLFLFVFLPFATP
jgi:hypothetical protein